MWYYYLSDEKADAIAQAGNLTVEEVRDFCCADWVEGVDHQDWLDAAPAQEIADWIIAGRD